MWIYVYPEFVSGLEWPNAHAAFVAAASLTGTTFEVATDFVVRGDGVVISPWDRTADASHFGESAEREDALLAFTMCAHGSMLPGGLRCPSSYDGCAQAAANAAVAAWGEWRPDALVALTHASTRRWRSVADDFAACLGASPPAVEVVTGVAEARRCVSAGEHASYALLVCGAESAEAVLENRAWFLSRNTKCLFIGELNDRLAMRLREAGVPYAEHRVYSDCFTAYMFALNARELRRHRPLPARSAVVAPTAVDSAPGSLRPVGCVIVMRGRDISEWDRNGRLSPGDETVYFDASGRKQTRSVAATPSERGAASGSFLRFPLLGRRCRSGSVSYAVDCGGTTVHLQALPQLHSGDLVELPGTLEHAMVQLIP